MIRILVLLGLVSLPSLGHARSVLFYGDSHSVGVPQTGVGFAKTLLGRLVEQTNYAVTGLAVSGSAGCDFAECPTSNGVYRRIIPYRSTSTGDVANTMNGIGFFVSSATNTSRLALSTIPMDRDSGEPYSPDEYRLEAAGLQVNPDVVVFALGTNTLCRGNDSAEVCRQTTAADVTRTLAALDRLQSRLGKRLGCVWLVPPHMCLGQFHSENESLWNRIDDLAGGACVQRADAHSSCTRRQYRPGRCEIVRLDTYSYPSRHARAGERISACGPRSDGIHLSPQTQGTVLGFEAYPEFAAAVERALR
jgi:hypothetical protein